MRRRGERAALLATVALVAVCLSPSALAQEGDPQVPFLSGRVVDDAGMLPPERVAELERRLARLEAETGHQMAVLTVPSLGGETVEDYSMRVAETWKLGGAEADDGVLLLVARDERELRLEVGYGLESELPDLEARRVLDDAVVPRFRQGDFAGGIEAGVGAVAALLEDPVDGTATATEAEVDALLEARSGNSGSIRTVVIGLFLLLVLTAFSLGQVGAPRGRAIISYILFAFFFFQLGAFFPFCFTWAPGVGWLIFYPLAQWLVHRRGWDRYLPKPKPGRGSGGWSLGGGSSSGGFSGGGFSGGGGSFGGGGASSSW